MTESHKKACYAPSNLFHHRFVFPRLRLNLYTLNVTVSLSVAKMSVESNQIKGQT